MFTTNPFAAITDLAGPRAMQVYALLMIAAVVFGTLFDIVHKRSGEYFARRRAKSRAAAQREVSGGQALALAVAVIGKEVLTAGEFCKWQRRVSHLFIAYGFVIHFVATALFVFVYPHASDAPILGPLWNVGALMIVFGGYWFFFFLRVDVAFEKRSPFHLVPADLFIGSLIMSATFGLLYHFSEWHLAGWVQLLLFLIYVLFTTLLFVSVPWSKFAHMFYKPVVAFQRRLEEANGSSDLPTPAQHSNIRG